MSHQYYELFDLPPCYAIDQSQLKQAWRQASARVHPDRFATASATEKRVAMQWASLINEAYDVLKSPVKRAMYLCEQAGFDLESETNTAMSPDFLMVQMQWREELDAAADNQEALTQLLDKIDQEQKTMADTLSQLIDQEKNWEVAVQKTREAMFIAKMRDEIKKKID